MLRGAVLKAAFAWAALAWEASVVVDGATWRVPLKHHVSTSDTSPWMDLSSMLAPHGGKHATVWEPAFPTTTSAAAAVPPVSVPFSVFYGTLYFGTPPQPVSVVLDISSPYAFVVNHEVDGRSFYDHAKSSTYQANGTRVRVLADTMDGVVSRDAISVGAPDSGDRINVLDHPLVEVVGPDEEIRQQGPLFRGWIGLGAGRTTATGATSLVRAMIDQGLLDRPEVGVSFREHDSHVVFGGVDAAYARSDFHYFDDQRDQWTVPLSGITVDDEQIVGDAGWLSYWPFVIGPKAAIEKLEQAVGAKNQELPCDGPGPDIVLALGDGFHVTLTKKDYTMRGSTGVCKFAFVTVGFDVWMLGLPFLRNVYTVLEHGTEEGKARLGLATIKP